MNDFDLKYQIVDSTTPANVPLSGRYKKSFGYYTIRERLPVILTQIQDYLSKEKDTLAGGNEQTKNDIKNIQANLSKLKYELQTDKIMEQFEGTGTDRLQWNEFLSRLNEDNNSYFKTTWLYAECYLYRKLKSFFEETETMVDFDYFKHQKTNALIISFSVMERVIEHVNQFQNKPTKSLAELEGFFTRLLKLNLWGNRCDLSISAGKEIKQTGNPFAQIDSLDSFILVNKCKDIWNCVNNGRTDNTIDFIQDNAGYELFTDLVLASYLLDNQLASKIRFHIKAIPWFISDVNEHDFHWTIDVMSNHDNEHLAAFGKKLRQYLNIGKFELCKTEYFWTGPHEFYEMKEVNRSLYEDLANSHLLIFKGDLNYRKLLGDFNWAFDSTFATVLRGFRPTNLCSLRTVKADLICEVDLDVVNELSKKDAMWMETGQYGVIHYISKQTKNDIKNIQANLSKLKYELQTDKIMEQFEGTGTDRLQWNEFLSRLNEDNNSYFKTTWLYAECYLYRKLKSFFEETETMVDFDYFKHQKTNALIISFSVMERVIEHVNQFQNKPTKSLAELEGFFTRLLKLNLWGNRCDLSISAGKEIKQTGNPFAQIDSLDSFILVNKCKDIWNCVNNGRTDNTIDFIQDNAGYELFTDLVLASYLLDNQLASKIRFHIKAIPWFISDVNEHDFHWTIDVMSNHDNEHLAAFGKKLRQYLNIGKFELCKTEYFWTGPHEFYEMKEVNRSLYEDLANSHLLIFKGDLNYRKLLGDFNWAFDSTFATVLRGFRPTNLCSLRTVKADLICEVDLDVVNELSKKDAMWMETGQYGVIHYISKV